MQHFLTIITRRYREIIVIAVLTTIASVAFSFLYNTPGWSATAFINIGVKQTGSERETIYDSVQAADHFAESIQGWFRNPEFIAGLEESICGSSCAMDFSARKQEKQNLVVTFKLPTEEHSAAAKKILHEKLNAEIDKFNSVTGSEVRIAIFDLTVKKRTIHPAFFGILGLISGLMLGYGFASLHERLNKELKQLASGKS